MKKIIILGSTGSVGVRALEVAKELGFKVEGISAGKNIELLKKQIEEFFPAFVCVKNSRDAQELSKNYKASFMSGKEGLCKVATLSDCEVVVNAVSGFAGLEPTFAAARCGKKIAIANKESIVSGGNILMRCVQENGAQIFPLDSEHNAIWQCLGGTLKTSGEVKKLILTCSGGPFFGYSKEELKKVTPEKINHPNWQMGPKISVDCATLINKGLEIAEAAYLFGVDPYSIEVVIHRESIIHSMVEFVNGSLIAQMSEPDMKIAIHCALSFPLRVKNNSKSMDLTKKGILTFIKPKEDYEQIFEMFRKALRMGEQAICTLNAANEVAVKSFLSGRIGFSDIPRVVKKVFESVAFKPIYSLESVIEANKNAEKLTEEIIESGF
ncbi:MAG: 1-deoxy-D-xylulose-5-phosphate reductoisomerase [Oscillospiraceae bacterium]|jgi:1-deoxy-D-xylulose-5-phosphate reductoisomerase|nr:1-deoxy-D-xylulose-5-phosphate reductoisomerase [Oscillospiraceae bacterium]